ncbi:hypothetical protein ACN38_g12768, partial [Penicillium nordicum]
ESELNL